MITVNPLVWVRQSSGGRGSITGQWWAETGFSLYSVYTLADGTAQLDYGHFVRKAPTTHPSLEAAQEAAQADFAARIRAALPERQMRLEDALRRIQAVVRSAWSRSDVACVAAMCDILKIITEIQPNLEGDRA